MKLWGVFALPFITKPLHKRNVGVSANLVEKSGGAGFFLQVGVYCTSTGRVMKFSKGELFDSLESAVDQIVWGDGRDQKVQKARKVEVAMMQTWPVRRNRPASRDILLPPFPSHLNKPSPYS